MGNSEQGSTNATTTGSLRRSLLLQRHQTALLELARFESAPADLDRILTRVTEVASRTLDVERTSVWLFDEQRTKITCRSLYERSKGLITQGAELLASDAPNYFRALEENRALAADDVQTDPRTVELNAAYLVPLGITSMLDAPIRESGRVIGIVCHEHVGPLRTWSIEEQHFVGSIADITAAAIEHFERVRAEEEVRRRDELLDGVAKAANRMFAESERDLEYRDALLAALAELATALATERNPNNVAVRIVTVVGRVLKVDRSCLYEDHEQPYTRELVASERARWRRDDPEADAESGLEIDLSYAARGLARWRDALALGRTIEGTVSSLPKAERLALEALGLGSVLAAPVASEGAFWGYLEVGDAGPEREWTPAEQSFLVAAAGFLGAIASRLA